MTTETLVPIREGKSQCHLSQQRQLGCADCHDRRTGWFAHWTILRSLSWNSHPAPIYFQRIATCSFKVRKRVPSIWSAAATSRACRLICDVAMSGISETKAAFEILPVNWISRRRTVMASTSSQTHSTSTLLELLGAAAKDGLWGCWHLLPNKKEIAPTEYMHTRLGVKLARSSRKDDECNTERLLLFTPGK